MIKLLPKNEIAGLKAKEKSREIDEGVKIATRVDNLRELWSKTEQDFEAYKISTLKAIQKEISESTEEKQKVSGELRLLKQEYESLLPEIPLKRAELSKFEKRLTSWEKRLDKREEQASLLEIDVAEAVKASENYRIMNEDNERISRNLLIQANKNRVEAENTLKSARKIQEQANKERKEMELALNLRELAIKTKEQELSSKEISIMHAQKELDKEKIQVNDQRQTLERSIERIRAGRLA